MTSEPDKASLRLVPLSIDATTKWLWHRDVICVALDSIAVGQDFWSPTRVEKADQSIDR